METRGNSTLEMSISQALLRHEVKAFTQGISVQADCNGNVWLRGLAHDRAACQRVKEVVSSTAGVTQVFCHMALRSHW